ITHNDALNDLDALAQISVINHTTATPPATPIDGDSYIVAASPTGAWAGSANAVATYYSGWRIKPAKVGWIAYVQAENAFYVFDGSSWAPFKGGQSRVGNSFAFLGDSRLAAQFNDGSTTAFPASLAHMKTNAFFFNWANALLGQRMKTVYNGAVSGYRSDQYLTTATVNGAIASGAKWLMIWGAVNDIGQAGTTGDTALTIWTRIKNATQSALNAGMYVVLLTEPGSNAYGTNTSSKAMTNQFNQYVREYADVTPGVFCFDIASLLVDPTQANITLRATYSSDGTHPNAYGAYYLGQAFANYIANFIPPINSQIFTASDISANGNIQQVANPLFLTTTGGTSGAGITGATPASFVSSVGGTATATISTAADSSGYGNAVTIAGNFAASGDAIYLKQDTTLANYTIPGDIVDSGVEIVINAGAVNLSQAALSTNFGGAPNPAYDLYGTATVLPNVAMDLTLRSVPFTLQTGTTWATWQVRFVGSGAGSFTATIKRPWMRRRFAI
ncbi:MAG: DUF2793 domain-containing protein, partial [Alphaproteobacteria bacterium]|nr:DUF2793 domain-containing protein [Alphaproteobacteria bacterium]